MARHDAPTNPAENTAQRTQRLAAEAREREDEQRQVTTTANMFGRPDGVDDKIYDPETGAVVDDGLSDDDQELFQEALAEVESGEYTDLGEGSFTGVEARPPTAVARERLTRVPRRVREAAVEEPAAESGVRQVLTRPPADPEQQFVLVQALDDINSSVGYNQGRTFKMDRGKTYKVPRYVALWLINQKYVGPPPTRDWLR